MNKFYTLTVNEISKLTPESVLIGFEIPKDIKDKFSFIPGQYLTIKHTIDGQAIRRSYSLCSAPHEDILQIGVKQIENGLFSTFACQKLNVGDTLEIMPPTGNFILPIPKDNASYQYMAFVAGSGITPVLSQIKDILKTQPSATFHLFYGNTNIKNIMFKEALKELKDMYLDRFIPTFFLSREKVEFDFLEGRISVDKCKEIGAVQSILDMDQYLLCGPEEMVNEISNYLKDEGVPKEKINFELFFTSSAAAPQIKTTKKTHKPSDISDITIILDGISLSYPLPYDDKSILDAAMDQGADVPYSCKGGICCTCKAKVLEGSVEMNINLALEEEEIDAGYVLTCQSRPTSSKVVLDFDV